MPNIYKELDSIIADYVGYDYDGESYDCTDPVLYDNLIDECTMYLKDTVPFDSLSKDAQACILEWEDLMKKYQLYQQKGIKQ